MFTLLSPLTIFVIYLLIVNLLAFIMYWRDKNLAIQGKWRIPENALMLVAEQFFNGGGHLNASGGKLLCSIEEAELVAQKAIMAYADLLK